MILQWINDRSGIKNLSYHKRSGSFFMSAQNRQKIAESPLKKGKSWSNADQMMDDGNHFV